MGEEVEDFARKEGAGLGLGSRRLTDHALRELGVTASSRLGMALGWTGLVRLPSTASGNQEYNDTASGSPGNETVSGFSCFFVLG